jgi:hypothetical protein
MPVDIKTEVSTEGLSWADITQQIMPDIRECARLAAAHRHVNERDLVKQLLLHLPRFNPDQLLDGDAISTETDRLARKLQDLRAGFSTWAHNSKRAELRRANFSVHECDNWTAEAIYTRFHYIGTAREAVAHLGVYSPTLVDSPMAVASLSKMDINALGEWFPSSEERKAVLVVSRVFAFDWAPRNSVSFLLGRVAGWVRSCRPGVRLLLTYLNPNLGFNGASYLAANWLPFVEIPVRYFYFRNDYITYRSFLSMPSDVKAQVVISAYKLEPLRMLRYRVRS